MTATCVSSDESRPYCTNQCDTDADCVGVEGFVCRQATSYSELGCTNWTPEEDCFPGGVPSTEPRKFCIAESKEIIADWDLEYGNAEAVPEDWDCNPSFYGSGDGCDCGCGLIDPDCGGDQTDAACGLGQRLEAQCAPRLQDEGRCASLALEVYVHCKSSAPCVLSSDNTTCGSSGSLCVSTPASEGSSGG